MPSISEAGLHIFRFWFFGFFRKNFRFFFSSKPEAEQNIVLDLLFKKTWTFFSLFYLLFRLKYLCAAFEKYDAVLTGPFPRISRSNQRDSTWKLALRLEITTGMRASTHQVVVAAVAVRVVCAHRVPVRSVLVRVAEVPRDVWHGASSRHLKTSMLFDYFDKASKYMYLTSKVGRASTERLRLSARQLRVRGISARSSAIVEWGEWIRAKYYSIRISIFPSLMMNPSYSSLLPWFRVSHAHYVCRTSLCVS